mmetsp:Transcript_38535/g.108953  ORF Transcript_38535/g.108953 Transcript_38535/m.108953 type:complete len:288 (+) Transcript_38535:699-1562(+)
MEGRALLQGQAVGGSAGRPSGPGVRYCKRCQWRAIPICAGLLPGPLGHCLPCCERVHQPHSGAGGSAAHPGSKPKQPDYKAPTHQHCRPPACPLRPPRQAPPLTYPQPPRLSKLSGAAGGGSPGHRPQLQRRPSPHLHRGRSQAVPDLSRACGTALRPWRFLVGHFCKTGTPPAVAHAGHLWRLPGRSLLRDASKPHPRPQPPQANGQGSRDASSPDRPEGGPACSRHGSKGALCTRRRLGGAARPCHRLEVGCPGGGGGPRDGRRSHRVAPVCHPRVHQEVRGAGG